MVFCFCETTHTLGSVRKDELLSYSGYTRVNSFLRFVTDTKTSANNLSELVAHQPLMAVDICDAKCPGF